MYQKRVCTLYDDIFRGRFIDISNVNICFQEISAVAKSMKERQYLC